MATLTDTKAVLVNEVVPSIPGRRTAGASAEVAYKLYLNLNTGS